MDISDFVEVAKRLNVLGIKITKDSELIAEWYSEAECRRNIYSATKSFTSCAVGFAVQEGLISLDEKFLLISSSVNKLLCKYIPNIASACFDILWRIINNG